MKTEQEIRAKIAELRKIKSIEVPWGWEDTDLMVDALEWVLELSGGVTNENKP